MTQPVNETNPSDITAASIAFAEALGAGPPQFIDVVDDPFRVFGFCAQGVESKVLSDGGERRCGWIIWETPGLFLTREFHAVWSNGERMAKPDGEARILFAPAPSYGADFNFTKRPNNRLFRSYQPDDPSDLVAQIVSGFSPSQHTCEAGRALRAGMDLHDWVRSRLPSDPKADLIDEFIAVIEKLHSLTVVTRVGSVLPHSELAVRLIRRQTSLRRALRF